MVYTNKDEKTPYKVGYFYLEKLQKYAVWPIEKENGKRYRNALIVMFDQCSGQSCAWDLMWNLKFKP